MDPSVSLSDNSCPVAAHGLLRLQTESCPSNSSRDTTDPYSQATPLSAVATFEEAPPAAFNPMNSISYKDAPII